MRGILCCRRLSAAVLTTGAMLAMAPNASATFPGNNGPLVYGDGAGTARTVLAQSPAVSTRFTDSTFIENAGLAYNWGGGLLAYSAWRQQPSGGFNSGGFINPSSSQSGQAVPNTAPGARDVTFSPDGTWVAFSAKRGTSTDTDIWAARVNGTDLVQLTLDLNDRNDSEPDWSPDGTKIVYVRDEAGHPKLRVLDLVTRADTQIVTEPDAMSPSWSPNGTAIAYANTSGGAGPIIIKTLSSSGPGVAVPNAAGIQPTFSPDGRQVAYVQRVVGGNQLRAIYRDGTDRRTLASGPVAGLQSLAWAQDCTAPPVTPGGQTGKVENLNVDTATALAAAIRGMHAVKGIRIVVPESVVWITEHPGEKLPPAIEKALAADLQTLETAVRDALSTVEGAGRGALEGVIKAIGDVRSRDNGPPCPPKPGAPSVRPAGKTLPLILVKGYQGDQMHGLSDHSSSAGTGAPCSMFNPLHRRFTRDLNYSGPIVATRYMRGDTISDGSSPDSDHEGPNLLEGCADISVFGRHGIGNGANHAEHWGTSWDCEKRDWARDLTAAEVAANLLVSLHNTFVFWEDDLPFPYARIPCPVPSFAIDTYPALGVAAQEDGPNYKMDHCRRWSQSLCVPGGRQPDWTHYAMGYSGERHTDNTPNQHVAYHLAWFIYETYSKHGAPVNVLSHSQGGTQVRYMLQEVALQRAGSSLAQGNFPPFLLINEVVSVDSTLEGATPIMNIGCDGLASFPSVLTFLNKGSDFQCLQQMGDSYFQQQGGGTRAQATGGGTPQTADNQFVVTQWAAIGAGEDVVAPRKSSLPPWVDFHIGYCGSQAGPRKLANNVLGTANVNLGLGVSGDYPNNTEAAETVMGSQFGAWENNNEDGGPPAGEKAGHYYPLMDYGDRGFKLNRFTYTNTLRGSASSRQAGPADQQQYACNPASKTGPQPLDMAFEAINRRDR